jgi:hypothetical protein
VFDSCIVVRWYLVSMTLEQNNWLLVLKGRSSTSVFILGSDD